MRITRYDHDCSAYTLTKDTYGQQTGYTILYASFDADVQPLSKSAAKMVELGLESVSSKMKALFHDIEYPLPLDTIVVDNVTSEKYKIVYQGPWEGHLEGIGEPWEGTL